MKHSGLMKLPDLRVSNGSMTTRFMLFGPKKENTALLRRGLAKDM